MNGLGDFANSTVVLTGTSSGMGAAALQRFAEAGAVVHAIDINDVTHVDGHIAADQVTAHRCDLGDQDAIDKTVAQLPNEIDALINCAGLPNGGRFSGEAVMRVNWLGLRHLTESLLPRMAEGGAEVHIASTAGREWQLRANAHTELMEATTFADGMRWLQANPTTVGDGYVLSKEAVQYYTLWRSVQLLPMGIRMNSICPGITNTGLIPEFRKGMGGDVIDHAQAVAGRMAEPAEMVPAMMFLASHECSSYINGVNLNIDCGTSAARASGQSDPDLIWGSPK